jgi:hypothetical protein
VQIDEQATTFGQARFDHQHFCSNRNRGRPARRPMSIIFGRSEPGRQYYCVPDLPDGTSENSTPATNDRRPAQMNSPSAQCQPNRHNFKTALTTAIGKLAPAPDGGLGDRSVQRFLRMLTNNHPSVRHRPLRRHWHGRRQFAANTVIWYTGKPNRSGAINRHGAHRPAPRRSPMALRQ